MLGLATITHDTDAASRKDPELLDRVHQNGSVVYVSAGKVGQLEGKAIHDSASCPDELLSSQFTSYLGQSEGTYFVSVEVEPDAFPDLEFVSLRELSPMADQMAEGLCVVATALAAWHSTVKYCTGCGGQLRLEAAGWEMACQECHQVHFPRHDPSVIMAIRDPEDRLLLGHAATWAPGRYSCLAGFVEAGETLEHAVKREAKEEASITVERVEYVASQPWPFPRSLMTAFRAWTSQTNDDIRVDGIEVTEARFFSREEFATKLADGSLSIPSKCSAGRALIEDWYGQELQPPAES